MAPLHLRVQNLPSAATTALRANCTASRLQTVRTRLSPRSVSLSQGYHSIYSRIGTARAANGLRLGIPAVPGRSEVSMVPARGYADLNASSGKREADLLVEELQELYEVAKDEFEIATDSTNSATIYAASDRESARDALNHLTRVYTLYTEMTTSSAPDTPASSKEGPTAPVPKEPVLQNADENAAAGRTDPLLSGDPASGPPLFGDSDAVVGITPNYNPEEIPQEMKEEVKRRVGQRIRELQNAVEALEKSAQHE